MAALHQWKFEKVMSGPESATAPSRIPMARPMLRRRSAASFTVSRVKAGPMPPASTIKPGIPSAPPPSWRSRSGCRPAWEGVPVAEGFGHAPSLLDTTSADVGIERPSRVGREGGVKIHEDGSRGASAPHKPHRPSAR